MRTLFTSMLATFVVITSMNFSKAQCYSAIDLDGINDYMYTPFNNYTFNTFTMEMWINSANYAPNEHYISLYQNAYIVLGGWGGGGVFNTWADGLSPIEISSPIASTPATGTWHHVAFVYDGANQILYIDGTPVTTTATSGSVNVSTGFNQGLVIGARYTQSTQFTQTTFEDVRIWNTARTQAQLTNFMSTNLVGNEPGLVAYYRFEDGAGSTTVTDLTGNGNTLTLYNMDPMTDWVAGPLAAATGTDVQNSCGPITWIDGNVYSADTLGATHIIPNGSVNGCDSIVMLDLTINSAVQHTDVISECDSYTWIDSNVYTASNNSAVYTFVNGAANGCDSIVTLNLTISSSSQVTDAHTACGSYTWVDGMTYTSSTNTPTYLVPGGAANGCDSVLTLDLTINTVDNTVTMNQLNLTSNESGAQYQWVDCDNNYAAIAGETNQTFTVTANGNYAVIVTATNGCTDTSACMLIDNVGVTELNQLGAVVYPNPNNGQFEVKFAQEITGTVKIVSLTGAVVKSLEVTQSNAISFDEQALPKGTYFIHVSNEEYNSQLKLIID